MLTKPLYIWDLYDILGQKFSHLGPLLHLGIFITFEASTGIELSDGSRRVSTFLNNCGQFCVSFG